MTDSKVTVLGAGIVGICCAIELQRAGFNVELLDRREPGSETSSGNAGILSLGSIAPLASPALLPRLPGLIANRYPDFRMHYPHLPELVPWLIRFLLRCNRKTYLHDGALMNALTVASVDAHRALIRESNSEHLMNELGGLRLYRQHKTFANDELERELFDLCGVDYTELDKVEIRDLEPDLIENFIKAVWVKNSISLRNPQELCQNYAGYFQSLGGVIKQAEVEGIKQVNNRWQLQTGRGQLETPKLVVCLGAWTPSVIQPLGYQNVMAIERGYHTVFAPQSGKILSRPIFDVDSSYVMIPMSAGLRITTGSNLTCRETTPTPKQIDMVVPRAREAFPLGECLLDTPWMGRRPSTPDSMPIIGPAPRHENLWLAFAHAHMGLTMGPITGQIIASQVCGSEAPLDTSAYLPGRYL